MTRAWFVYYGYQLGMDRAETMAMPYGEFMDLMTCRSIENGDLRPLRKSAPRKWDYDEAIALR